MVADVSVRGILTGYQRLGALAKMRVSLRWGVEGRSWPGLIYHAMTQHHLTTNQHRGFNLKQASPLLRNKPLDTFSTSCSYEVLRFSCDINL